MLEKIDVAVTGIELCQSQKGDIFKAIPKVMKGIGAIGKDRDNKAQGFKFRGIDDVYNEVQKVLAEHGVFTVPRITARSYKDRTNQNGGIMIERILTIRYRFYAGDGSYFDAEVDGEARDSGDKTSSKCLAIAHKYALLQVLCIPTEDDKDPDAHTPPAPFAGNAPAPSGKPSPVKPKDDKKGKPPAAEKPKGKPRSEATKQIAEMAEAQGWKLAEVKEFMQGWFGKDAVDDLTGAENLSLQDFISGSTFEQAMKQLDVRSKRK